VAKDIQMFLRDPVQVMQFLVFFGLLAFYIVNLKNMRYDISLLFWKNLITHLNLGSVCLILATLATRFLYPSISLEGKAIWILSFSPLSSREIIWVKYGVAAFLTLCITLPLTLLSNHMLSIGGLLGLYSVVTAIVTGLTLAALSIGLGALFPNFNATHAQAIVSGFGGTLTLVLSLVYISIMVGIPGFIGHLTVLSILTPSKGILCQGLATMGLSLLSLGLSWMILEKGVTHLKQIEI
jgi:ABC-2 type transport system permease protein